MIAQNDVCSNIQILNDYIVRACRGWGSIAMLSMRSLCLPWQRIQKPAAVDYATRKVMSRKDLEALGSQRESLSTNPLLVKVSIE